jgi:hypothetical protein
MKIRDYGRLNALFAVMAAVALVLAIIGIIGLPSTPYAGFQLTADARAFNVDPLGPAAKAGLKEGDEVIQVGLVTTDQLHQLAKQARPTIGEELKVSILRDRVRRDLSLMQTSLPGNVAAEKWAGNLMALVMLALGLFVFWYRPSKPSSLFFMSNLCFALAFTTPPYFQQDMLRTIVSTNAILFLTMGLAFLLHLSSVFPKPKGLVEDSSLVELLIYLPAPVMALSFLALLLFEPKADLLINLMLHYIFALVILACLVLSLGAVLHSVVTVSATERARGLGVMLAGFILGAIPPAAKFFIETFMPGVNLTGQPFYSLAAILVSLGFAWALWKSITTPTKEKKEEPAKPVVFKKVVGQ